MCGLQGVGPLKHMAMPRDAAITMISSMIKRVFTDFGDKIDLLNCGN